MTWPRLLLALVCAACRTEPTTSRPPADPLELEPRPTPASAPFDAAPASPTGLVRRLEVTPQGAELAFRAVLDNPFVLAGGDTVAIKTTCRLAGGRDTRVTAIELPATTEAPRELTWSALHGGGAVGACQLELTRIRRDDATALGVWCHDAGALAADRCEPVPSPPETLLEASLDPGEGFLYVSGHVAPGMELRDPAVWAKAVCAGAGGDTLVTTASQALAFDPLPLVPGDRAAFYAPLERPPALRPALPVACSLAVGLGRADAPPTRLDQATFCWQPGRELARGACPKLSVTFPSRAVDVRPPPAGVRVERLDVSLGAQTAAVSATVRLTAPVGLAHVMVRGWCEAGARGRIELRPEQLTGASLALMSPGERAHLARDLYHLADAAPERCEVELALGFPWLATMDTPLGHHCADAQRVRRGRCR